jgi:hypothetical protein
MIILTLGPRLNAPSWAEVLRSQGLALASGLGQPEGLAGEHVFVDLSKVGYADFVAVGHLITLIRAVTDAGGTYKVRLPDSDWLPGEDPRDPADAMRRIRRRNCALFLDQTGFRPALPKLPEMAVRAFEEPAVTAPAGDVARGSTEDAGQLPHRDRMVLPYRWVSADFARGLTTWDRSAGLELALRELGLPSEDSAALAKGVLAELLENVAEHSGATAALLGGIIVRADTYSIRTDDFDDSLHHLVRWAADTSSPLVRLVVADAGRGIDDAPDSSDDEESDRPRRSPEKGGDRDAVLYALDRRYSATGTDRTMCGLPKVTWIIRGYQGGILIHTGGRRAGRIFADELDGTEFSVPGPGLWPGTVVECVILTRPESKARQAAGSVPTPKREQGESRSDLQCITATLRVGEGLAEGDLRAIRTRLADLPHETAGLVVAVDVPNGGDAPDDTEISKSVGQILTIAGESTGPATIALAFQSINRPLLSVAVEDLNDLELTGRDHPGLSRPVLVLAPENRHFWVGGTPVMRHVLQALSKEGKPLGLRDLSEGVSVVAAARAVRELNEQTGLLHASRELMSLRIRPQDAVTAMASYIGDEIRRAIEQASHAGVWDEGNYLTPNLRITTRWCDLDLILTDLRLRSLSGVALASRVGDRLGRLNWGNANPLIVRVGSTPQETVSALARTLTGRDEYFDSLDDMRLERVGRALDEPARVLLVTDLISTCRTVVHALASVVDREMTPVGVAALVDARPLGDVRVEPAELVFLGLRVPLVSLAMVDIEPDQAQEPAAPRPTPIDPVLRRPEAGRSEAPHVIVDQGEYIAAVERNGAARLGHIERPAGRHYTAYVDPTLLFRETEWADKVLQQLATRIWKTHRAAFAGNGPPARLCLLYPEPTADDLPEVARQLKTRLEATGAENVEIVAVPHAAHGRHWHLPAALPLDPELRHVTILDSAASTGHTMRQLIRLAVDNNVNAVTGILLLNGLSDSEALAFQQVATMRRSTGTAAHRSSTVQVNMHYVARTAMGKMDGRSCSICELRRRYQPPSLHLPVPIELEKHRDWLLSSLEPMSKPAAYQRQAIDLLGGHVSQADCVEYLRWRFDLREAARSTVQRQELVKKLDDAAKKPSIRDALIRLLVAESHRLGEAPLWFPDCRATIADLAVSALLGEGALAVEQMLRVQAVILLAHAVPQEFASRVSALLTANRYQEPVVLQIFLEALRLISRPSAPTSYARDFVTRPLMQDFIAFETMLRERQPSGREQPESIPLSLVRYLLSHGRRALQPMPTEPQDAWVALREYRSTLREHEYDNAMWRIMLSIGLIGRGRPPADLESIRNDWAICCNLMMLDVLPNVHLLRGPLTSRSTIRDLHSDDLGRWERVLNGEGQRDLDELGIRLNGLLDQVQSGGDDAVYSVSTLLTDLESWFRLFMRGAGPGIGLPNLIDRCPTHLWKTLQNTFRQADLELGLRNDDEDEIWVFCTEDALGKVLGAIRASAEHSQRGRTDATQFEITISQPDAGHVTLNIRSTVAASMVAIDDYELKLFGGAVTLMEESVAPWKYRAAVTVQRWRAGV